MEFYLFYKRYEFKVTWQSKVAFKRETGRDLWSVLMGVLAIQSDNRGKSILELMRLITEHVDSVDAAHLFKAVCINDTSIAVIADGIDRAGWLPIEDGSEKGQPYPFVLLKMASDINTIYHDEAIQAKKDFGD